MREKRKYSGISLIISILVATILPLAMTRGQLIVERFDSCSKYLAS
jgi:hypothetical protein